MTPTVEALAQVVKSMRDLQKLYFRARSQMTLEQCKTAEKEVDRVVAAILDPPETDLFSQGEP